MRSIGLVVVAAVYLRYPQAAVEEPGPVSYGEELLRRLGAFEAESGMYANLGIRVTSVGERTVELVANPTAAAHGFPSPGGEIIHGGAVATIADCALACAALTVAEEGELCMTPTSGSSSSARPCPGYR